MAVYVAHAGISKRMVVLAAHAGFNKRMADK
jgi:hypothetical protein